MSIGGNFQSDVCVARALCSRTAPACSMIYVRVLFRVLLRYYVWAVQYANDSVGKLAPFMLLPPVSSFAAGPLS